MYVCVEHATADGTSVLMLQDSISIFELAEKQLVLYIVPAIVKCIPEASALSSCLHLPITSLITAVCRKLQQSGKVCLPAQHTLPCSAISMWSFMLMTPCACLVSLTPTPFYAYNVLIFQKISSIYKPGAA